MASLWITEASVVGPGNIMPLSDVLAHQVLTVGAEVDSAAFNVQTRYIRVYADTACHVLVSGAPTATVSHTPIGIGVPEYFAVTQGSKLSVIAAA